MLEKLLVEIEQGGTLELGVLADRLGTSPQMIKVMLGHLEQMGKLADLAACMDSSCGACSLTGMCSSEQGKGARVWQVIH